MPIPSKQLLEKMESDLSHHEKCRLHLAEHALQSAGFTQCENGSWKPPLGKPVGPILDSLDAERETKTVLTGRIMDLAAAALPHMPVDEHLRIAGVKAINAALAVMEGRKP